LANATEAQAALAEILTERAEQSLYQQGQGVRAVGEHDTAIERLEQRA